MKEVQRYFVDSDGQEEKCSTGLWVKWRDIEPLFKELDDMTAKAIAAVWLLPEDVDVAQLQEFRTEAEEVLSGKDKQTIAKLQDELASVRAAYDTAMRLPGVNAVYGIKSGARRVLYPLMLTSVKHAHNGGLEIEVQLP